MNREDFVKDAAMQAQAERWLQLAAECCLDLTHHVIADRGWKTPSSYREGFEILESEGVLPSELAKHMVGWAGLRNLLVHLYLEIDHARIHAVLCDELDQLEQFAGCLLAELN